MGNICVSKENQKTLSCLERELSPNAAFILGFGHPILDIITTMEDHLADEYNFRFGDCILGDDSHKPLFEKMTSIPSTKYVAGGTTLNSIRTAQWVLGRDQTQSAFIGCIGNDTFGQQLRRQCNIDGLHTKLQAVETHATGTCGVAVRPSDKERAMVTVLGAANSMTPDFLENNIELIKRASVVYTTAFFFNCMNGAHVFRAFDVARSQGALVTFNIAAPYLISKFHDELVKAIGLSDFVFCNDSEAKVFGEEFEIDDKSLENIAKYIATIGEAGGRKVRYSVITCGSKHTLVAGSDGTFMKIPVPKLDKSLIVDLNGAGDSFVGGFLAALSKGQNVEACVKTGNRAARSVIQQSGCSFEGEFSLSAKPDSKKGSVQDSSVDLGLPRVADL